MGLMTSRVCAIPTCGNDLPKGRKRYCSTECQRDGRREYFRIPKDDKPCRLCGEMFTPYHLGDEVCQRPECRRRKRREDERRSKGVGVELDDDSVDERRDEQMSRLFRDYHARESISIDEREDGTRCVIISDAQIPFIDEDFWRAFLRFLGKYRPHDLFINGDWIDAYEVSDFDKRPSRLFSIDTEIEMAKDTLREIRKRLAVDGRIYWADGNHEERWNKAIWRHAGPLAAYTADLYTALDLEHLADGYVPYGKHFDYLGFLITHGNYVSQYSAYTARKHYDRYHSSGCNGHTHRVGSYSHTDGKGRSHTWFEIGCFCRKDLEYVKGVANWQNGFLIGTVWGGAFHPQLVRVIETDAGRAFFADGERYMIFSDAEGSETAA